MNRMIKLFQQKSDRKFQEAMLLKAKAVGQPAHDFPSIHDIAFAVSKAEADTWSKAAELLRKEELQR